MYEIFVQETFSAAHNLRGYPGNCEQKHGHNWVVEVCVECSELDSIGIGIDFREVKKIVREVIKDLDHKDLNEILPFDKENPSSENIAKYIYNKTRNELNNENCRISKIKVCESANSGVIYYPDKQN